MKILGKVPVKIGDTVTYKEGSGFYTIGARGKITHFDEWPSVSVKWFKPKVYRGSYSTTPKDNLVVCLKRRDERYAKLGSKNTT